MSEATTCNMDWYTKSFRATLKPENIIPQENGWKVVKELGKIRQYPHGYLLSCGGYLLLSSDEKQGSMLELSGDPLAALRGWGLTDDEIIAEISKSEYGNKTTRIDYCWNVPGKDINPKITLDAWNKKQRVTRIKTQPEVRAKIDPETGELDPKGMTVYYGSEKAPQRVTVYDKAFEMGLLGKALTRVEMRLRSPYSQLLVIDAVKHDIMSVAQAKLRKVLDFPSLDWWQAMYTDYLLELSPHKPKSPNAIPYLKSTVDAFISKNISDPDFANVLVDLMGKWASMVLAGTPDLD